MKTKLRLISTILILSMIFPILSGIVQPVFAAASPLNIYIDQGSYNQNERTLKLRWDTVYNAQTCTIKYHIPGSSGPIEVVVPDAQIDLASSTAIVAGIKNDIIYDFEVSITDIYGDTYSGKKYFLPQISVYAEQVDQQYVAVAGGGYESGIYPAIKISWNIPQIYSNSQMKYANDASKPLKDIDGNIKEMNFTFHLLSKSKDPNTGAIAESLANVEVKMDPNATNPASMYTASVSGDTTMQSDIKWDAATGKYTFYILGLKDNTAPIPTMTEIIQNKYNETGLETLPKAISQVGDNKYVLLHKEVRPGSIYVIKMDTLFYDENNTYMDALERGVIQSPLVGKTNYTYTPIRFQLTKDSLDYIYVRVFKVNAGDIQLPDLYYEIQTSDVPSNQDSSWTSKYQLKDKNFGGVGNESAIAVIQGINPRNTVYYRIVVKSDAVDDRIQSLNLPYKMQDDTARPPVPKNIIIAKVELEQVPAAQGEKTSNITITWDKPSNWDEVRNDSSKEIYFHFLLNINAKDMDLKEKPLLTSDGYEYGHFDVKYRLVKYVSSRSPNITVTPDGAKLIYKLNGLELFKWEDENGDSQEMTTNDIEKYPTYLLQNKTYYLQMYTTLAADKGEISDALKMSDKSLIESFTTLSPSGREVPTPHSIELVETAISTTPLPSNATVKIRFDDLNIDWNNYTSNLDEDANAVIYDLYMSTSTDPKTFLKIGTTEAEGDIKFEKQTINNTTWVYSTINKFTGDNNIRFGNSLTPNATYYFMIKVRLRMIDKNGDVTYKESLGTALLPVTTPRGEATTPDDTAKRPLAPTDFAIALDSEGNPMVTGQSVTFEWTVQEKAVSYNLIATTNRVEPDTNYNDASIVEDSIYKSFISVFGNKDDNADGNPQKLTLDPNLAQYPANFTYDSKTKKCRYTIDTWLYPNKIYYFTIRAELEDGTDNPKASVWVSIPVTTSLIESPSMLQVVNNCELAFYWYDTLENMTTDNYKIQIKAAGENKYTQLAKTQYRIVKDGTIYYARIISTAKLKPNTNYNIKVIRSISNDSTKDKELNTFTLSTRNDNYEIDVKWQGYAIDPFSGFEIAIKTEDDSDYTVLSNATDLEQYFDTSTQTYYPYYIEKSNNNLGTSYYTYNARIKLAEVTLPDGSKEHRPLKPNTKYYIKVRAVKYDSTNMQAFTASKYIGPVETRTEFSQDDYDDNDNVTTIVAKFLDMIEDLENRMYWDIGKKNGVANKVLVKDDKIINLLEGYGHYSCTIDIDQSLNYINSDEIYISKNVLEAMKANNKSIIIKAKDIEYTIRPETFNIEDMKEFEKAEDVDDSKDVYLQINNTQSTSMIPSAPSNTTAASKMNIFSAQAVTSMKTSDAVNAMIKDKIYNDTTGLVKKKLAVIQNPNNTKIKKDAKEVNEYLEQLYEELKSELSYYLEDTLNGVGYTEGVLANKFNITKFASPLGVKMPYKSDSIANPYVVYSDVGNWQKLTQNLKYDKGYLSFFVTATGKYAIFSSRNVSDTISDDSAAKPYISKLAANYDLTTVFPGADKSFNPDLKVTVKEIILLYELISEGKNDSNTDAKVKAKEYGIDKIINITNMYRNITRQEAAAIATKLYCQMSGLDYNKLKVTYGKAIKDNNLIDQKYAMPVNMCLKMNLMTLDSSGKFNPKDTITRAQIAVVIQKVLES